MAANFEAHVPDEFKNSLWGYNKSQVDRTLYELTGILSDMRKQLKQNELDKKVDREKYEKTIMEVKLQTEVEARSLAARAKEKADELVKKAEGTLELAERQAASIVSEAEKFAGEIVDEAEESISFARAYTRVLNGMNGEINLLVNRHFINFLNDLTGMVKDRARQEGQP